jgi:acrylyl-CoA reductase (NADPH)
MPLRIEAWRRLSHELDRRKLSAMTRTISFDGVFEAGERILRGETRGRLVVGIG